MTIYVLTVEFEVTTPPPSDEGTWRGYVSDMVRRSIAESGAKVRRCWTEVKK